MRVSRTLQDRRVASRWFAARRDRIRGASVITSSDIKDETIQNRDIDKGVITMNRFAQSTQDKINQAGTRARVAPPDRRSCRAGRPAGATERRVLPGPQGLQGPPGAAAAAEFGVATFFVLQTPQHRRRASRVLSVPLGTPAAATTSGQFRFSCASRSGAVQGLARSRRHLPHSGPLGLLARVTHPKEEGHGLRRADPSASTQTEKRPRERIKPGCRTLTSAAETDRDNARTWLSAERSTAAATAARARGRGREGHLGACRIERHQYRVLRRVGHGGVRGGSRPAAA